MNLFSSMLQAAQRVDGTELDQTEQHEAKPNSANWEKDDFFQQDGFSDMIYSSGTWVIELAQGRQWVWAAGNKNGGTNHVSDRPDLCQIKMTTQPFLKKNAHRETRSEKHTVYKSCLKSSYPTRKHPSSWESHGRGSLAVEFTTYSHSLSRSTN